MLSWQPISLVSIFVLCVPLIGSAQPPTLNPPFPLGAQRGRPLEFELTGGNLQDPVKVHSSFPATATFPKEGKNGQEAGKLKVRLEVAPDAPLGWHSLRLETKRGLSNLRLFCIDDLPQVQKTGTPNKPEAAQAIPVPCVVCGTMQREKTDYYRIKVPAGRLSIDVLGRRLGSNLDPQIAILDPKTLRQLAFSDDAPGQQKDPRLSHVFTQPGEYLLEVRDVRYQGGDDWHYRIRLGDFPLATVPVPLAVHRDAVQRVTFAGPYVFPESDVKVAVRKDEPTDGVWIWPRSKPLFPTQPEGLAGWPVFLAHSDFVEYTEAEMQTGPPKLPCGISGRLEKPGEKDDLPLLLPAGQRLIIEAPQRQAGSPTNLYLVLLDETGKQLATSNPTVEPARIDFTAPKVTKAKLQVEHLHYLGDAEQAYRVVIAPYRPSFKLSAEVDRLHVPAEGMTVLQVRAERQEFNGPIALKVEGPAGVLGEATLGEGQNAVLLPLRATVAVASGSNLRIMGTAAIGGQPVKVPVRIDALVSRNLANLAVPPRQLGSELALGLLPAAPFQMEAKYVHPEGVRGLAVPVAITLKKNPGFDEEVSFSLVTLPPAPNQPAPLPALAKKLPKGQSTTTVDLKPIPQTPDGLPVYLIATTKAGGIDIPVTLGLPPLKLTAPVEVTVTPPPELRLGKRVEPSAVQILESMAAKPALASAIVMVLKQKDARPSVKVTIARKGGYAGPVVLELKNLPAGVTAGPTTLQPDQTSAIIPLTLADGAAAAAKADVLAVGTAPAAGNQQGQSAPFTVKVVK